MSANTAGAAVSFKLELLQGIHDFATDTFKGALYYAGSGLGPGMTAYSTTGEVVGSGYTAGGLAITNGTAPASSGITAYWTPSAALKWSALTISTPFDCWLLYNASKANRAVAVFTFPSQTAAGGVLLINMPANAPSTALLNLS